MVIFCFIMISPLFKHMYDVVKLVPLKQLLKACGLAHAS